MSAKTSPKQEEQLQQNKRVSLPLSKISINKSQQQLSDLNKKKRNCQKSTECNYGNNEVFLSWIDKNDETILGYDEHEEIDEENDLPYPG